MYNNKIKMVCTGIAFDFDIKVILIGSKTCVTQNYKN